MKTILKRVAALAATSMSIAVLMTFYTPAILAQSEHTHQAAPQSNGLTLGQSELLSIVRQSTERFKDVNAADAEGYKLQFGCVTGPDAGAMGLHYVKGEFVQNTPL